MLDKPLADIGPQDVMNVLTTLKSFYQKRNDEVKTDVELYNRDYTLGVPAGFIGIKSPTTKAVPDRAADRLGQGLLQTHMEPRRPGQTEKDRIEQLEKAAASLVYLARKRAKYNPIRAMALHGFNRGAICVKFMIDPGADHETPERSDFETDYDFEKAKKLWGYRQLERFPLMLDVRPIESIYPDPETDGDNFVIENYRRRVGDIKKNYPNWDGWDSLASLKKDGGQRKRNRTFKDDETVEYTEIWTREWRAAIVEGQWLPLADDLPEGPVPNLYGRPPYFIRYSGFGDPSGKPEEKCVSILRAVRDVAKMESRLLTIVDKLAEDEAYGSTVIDSKDEAAKATMQFGPAAIIESDMLGEGKGPRPYKPQNNLDAALQALGVSQRATESGAVPGEAIGQPSQSRTGTPSGVAAAILTGQASMVIDPCKGAIEDLLSDLIPFMFYVIDDVWARPLKIYGQVGEKSFVSMDLKPDVIDGHYGPVYVTLKLRAPEQDHASWNLGIQAMSAVGPQPWVFEKFFAIENADSFVKQMMVLKLAYSDETMAYLNARLIERLQAKANNTADTIPGSKVPAPGPLPAPGMGVDPTTGQPMMRADGSGGPPMDPMMKATLGIAPGPQIPGGVAQVTPGSLV